MQTLETPTQESVQITVNEQLQRLEDLVTAIEYYVEELRTREGRNGLMDVVRNVMTEESFYRRIINYIKRYQVKAIARDVTVNVKEEIEPLFEGYINAVIDDRIESVLRRNGVI